MSDALEALKRMIGIPASVGVCEPVEGFIERPHDAADCMREMAAEIKRLRAALEQKAEAEAMRIREEW